MALKKAAAELDGRLSTWAFPKIRPTPTSPTLSPPTPRTGQADDRRRPRQGDRVRLAGRFRVGGRPGFARPLGRAISSSTWARLQPPVCRQRRPLHRGAQVRRPPRVVFHNGVFGMFEDSRFEEGTREFVAQLKRMTDAGLKVYIGGGEGGAALEKYGRPDWVTYTSPPAGPCSTPWAASRCRTWPL